MRETVAGYGPYLALLAKCQLCPLDTVTIKICLYTSKKRPLGGGAAPSCEPLNLAHLISTEEDVKIQRADLTA